MVFDHNLEERLCLSSYPKNYAWVHIFFMLNLYLTLQWLFGRLHPRGVDVQVEDAWSAWVPEDGVFPIILIFLCFGVIVVVLWLGVGSLIYFICWIMFWGTFEFLWGCIWDFENHVFMLFYVEISLRLFIFTMIYAWFWINEGVIPWTFVINCWFYY